MSYQFAFKGLGMLSCAAILLMVPSCSKEKEAAVTPPSDAAPAMSMKEPSEVAAPAKSGGATVRARFDGYAARVSKGLWQPVPLATDVANFGLITPVEAIPAGSGLQVEGGPEGLAVGTPAGTLQTAEGQPLVAGQEYVFAFSKGEGDIWSVSVTAVP
jgi:hypothetical protein